MGRTYSGDCKWEMTCLAVSTVSAKNQLLQERILNGKKSTQPMVVIRALPWDTRHFGMQICRVEAEPGDTAENLASSLARSDFSFASARTSTEDAWRLGLLQEAGFRIADVRTYLDLNLDGFKAPETVSETQVTDYEKRYNESLKQIAQASFWSDHFHADPRFRKSKVDEMYALWVDKCVREGYTILVGSLSGTPVGFLAGKRAGSAFYIELVAVGKNSERRGVGRALVTRALTKASGSFKEATVAVQLNNVPALRLYERLGFRITRSEFTFHWWKN